MKKQFVWLSVWLGLSMPILAFGGAEKRKGAKIDLPEKQKVITFRGFYADEHPEGIYNPERGFRLTDDIDVEGRCAMWDPERKIPLTKNLLDKHRQREADSISLVTGYFYIHNYIDKRLDDRALATVHDYLGAIRQLGKKALIRFAYELGYNEPGPTEARIHEHLQQLKPVLAANRDVIYILQAGFVGCWGEWHDSKHQLEKDDRVAARILSGIVDILPEGRHTQVRYPPFKELLKNDSLRYSRIGLHDDFVILDSETGGAAEMFEGGKWFPYMVEQSYVVPVDGELPPFKDWPEVLPGNRVARQLFLEHYASLSAQTRYEENMIPWKKEMMEEAYLKAQGMPYADTYFKDSQGRTVKRSAFEYIRDHLGYRLELQQLQLKKVNRKTLDLNLSLVNRGFARVYNQHPVYFVLVDANGNVHRFATDADVHSFEPHAQGDPTRTPLVHAIQGRLSVGDLPKGTYALGLWIPDGDSRLMFNRRYAIRCANGGEVKWWISPDEKYGINLLTTVTLR